jgi:hypothetical protein
MARVVDGVLETGAGGAGTSFFVDPGGVDRLSTELQTASSRLFEAERDVRAAVAAVDEPSAGSIIGLLAELGARTAGLAETTGTVGERVDRPLTQVAFAGSGMPGPPVPDPLAENTADLFLRTPDPRPDPRPGPAKGVVPVHTPGARVPIPTSRAQALPPPPEPSPFRDRFPLIPWPLFGVTDPSQEAAEQFLHVTQELDSLIPFAVGVTGELRLQLRASEDVRLPRLGAGEVRGVTYGIETARTLTVQDPLGGAPSAVHHVFGRTGTGGEGKAGISRGGGRGNYVEGLYQDVVFVRSPGSVGLDRQGGSLPDRLDPGSLLPGDQIVVTQRARGDYLNSWERTVEGDLELRRGFHVGVKRGERGWEGHRVALQRLPDTAGGDERYALDVGSVEGERTRFELFGAAGPSGATVKGALQVNNRDETLEGLRYLFGGAATDPHGYALAGDALRRGVRREEPQFPPGTPVLDYWRHRYEQTVDVEPSGELARTLGAGALLRGTLTGHYEQTERTRELSVESNGPGGWTTYLDHGRGEETVTIRHYGVDPALDGEISLDVPVPGIGATVSLGALHLGGLREPFTTTIARREDAGEPEAPVRIAVEALGERREFTEEHAQSRAYQLAVDGDPRAANPVIRSLAQGERWKDAIGFSGASGGGGDLADQFRVFLGPSNRDIGEAAIALTDPVVPSLPLPDPRREAWPETPAEPPGETLWNWSASLGEPALWSSAALSSPASGYSFADAAVLDYRHADLAFADTSVAWPGLDGTGGDPAAAWPVSSFSGSAFATAATDFSGFDFSDHSDAWATAGTDLFGFDSGDFTGSFDASGFGDFGGFDTASGDSGFDTADMWDFMA